MALNGTLADLGIVDLIQFPHKGRRTGELVVAGTEGEARLYYNEGALCHAGIGDVTGIEALVSIVSWEEGEFEFRTGIVQDQRTIDIDLHRALMLALKTRDERAETERKMKQHQDRSSTSETQRLLEEIIVSSPHLQGACLVTKDGALLAEAVSDEEDPAELAALRDSIIALYKNYARSGLTRTFLEDERSVAHGVQLEKGPIALLAATRETSMGALSLTMNKLATAILEKL
jgi:predicted regulator of Ras-like GTPase activity (Roadblock/LC7/MglB family)